MREKIYQIFEYIKSKKKIFIGVIALAIVSVIVIILINNNTFADTPKDTVTITCPETASAGETIECSINANIATITALSVNANYNTTLGLTYDSFTSDSTWVVYASSENGFAVGNTNGVTGSNVIGTLKYKVPDDAKANDTFTITLTNVEFSDANYDMVEADNSTAEIRILSDINTLSSLSITGATLNETFDPNTNNYTATSDSDSITINVEKTDENSTVTGDTGKVDLHYGTNNFSIVVTGETKQENTYNLSVFRPYKFSSSNYVYNEDNNYLYTKADTNSETILSNIEVPSELTASINDSKLNISYITERLLEIDIINISSTKYTIVNNNIFIGKDTTYETFNNNITLNGVTIKIFNGTDEVTEGSLEDTYKIKVYYNDTELETYNINEDYLNFDSSLNIDDTNKIIKRLVLNTTYSSLLEKIDTTGTITIKRGNNNLSNSDTVATGDVISIRLSSGTYNYTVSVLGDINGKDGINNGDVAVLYNYLKGKTTLEKYQIAAGDIINDGNIKINDVSRLYRYYKGKVSVLEVTR